MQTDPIGYEDGMNWYAYVGNDPITMTDPTGESRRENKFSAIAVAVAEGFGGKKAARNMEARLTLASETASPKELQRALKIVQESKPKISQPYKRPSNATTQAQRASVQGKACVDCGTTTTTQVADHKEPLVKEYYRTGTIDKTKMKSLDAVQPQCPTCSAKQGAEMSKFSKAQKKELGL